MDTRSIGRRHLLLGLAIAVPISLSARSSLALGLGDLTGGASSLITGLGTSLGVSPTQALGGAGSLMNVAKSSLGSEQFASIAKQLPGLDGVLGQASKLTGGSLPTTMAGATESFKKLGLKPEDVSKFAGYIGDYLGKSGGGSAAKLLKGVWGG